MENFDKLRLENERLRKKVRELETTPPEAGPQSPCPTCGCRLYKETGPCAGEDAPRSPLARRQKKT